MSKSSSSSSESNNNIWDSVEATPSNTVPLPVGHDMDRDVLYPEYQVPSFLGKLWSKTKQDPLIPIGFMATLGCLLVGVANMGTGNQQRQQMLMRGRVGFQAFTLGVFVWGLGSHMRRESAAQAAVAEKKAAK